MFGRLRANPTFLESTLDDIFFILLDRYRRLIDAQNAGSLAGRGTNAARELGKVIGGVQSPHRFLPTPVVDQIIPVGNEITHRTSRLAERYAAIHAARSLFSESLFGKIEIDFEPVIHTLRDRTARCKLARIFKKACCFTHSAPVRAGRARGAQPEQLAGKESPFFECG